MTPEEEKRVGEIITDMIMPMANDWKNTSVMTVQVKIWKMLKDHFELNQKEKENLK